MLESLRESSRFWVQLMTMIKVALMKMAMMTMRLILQKVCGESSCHRKILSSPVGERKLEGGAVSLVHCHPPLPPLCIKLTFVHCIALRCIAVSLVHCLCAVHYHHLRTEGGGVGGKEGVWRCRGWGRNWSKLLPAKVSLLWAPNELLTISFNQTL